MPDIVKTDGSVEAWDSSKLVRSLVRAGASETTAERIRETIEATIAPTEQSSQIYRRAFTMLRQEARSTAARYSLRRALFEFGPSGHPFEDFVSELFKSEGWEVQPRQILQGKCVPHEVDVYAIRNGEHLAAELKYHNDPGYKTDVKIALYVKARMDDIWAGDGHVAGSKRVDHGFLITNTKFTRQAIDYATCSSLSLLGWSYPHQGNLYDRIVASGLYPITALTTLRKAEKRLLIDQNIITTELLREHRQVLRELGVSSERVGAIVAEIETLRDTSKDVILHHAAS
ncbi:MAG: restriction endonuclease [Patescibacteria group bacterium]